MPGKSVKFAQRMKFGRCAPRRLQASCVCDGTYSNGARLQREYQKNFRIPPLSLQDIGVPS